LDFGFWILDFGFWILDFGFWILDFGFWILDFGFWILDFGFCASKETFPNTLHRSLSSWICFAETVVAIVLGRLPPKKVEIVFVLWKCQEEQAFQVLGSFVANASKETFPGTLSWSVSLHNWISETVVALVLGCRSSKASVPGFGLLSGRWSMFLIESRKGRQGRGGRGGSRCLNEVWNHLQMLTNLHENRLFAIPLPDCMFACCSGGQLESFDGILIESRKGRQESGGRGRIRCLDEVGTHLQMLTNLHENRSFAIPLPGCMFPIFPCFLET
jgi:hypothetical protein